MKIFERENTPIKGLMAFEWVIMGYLLITLAIVLIMYNKMADPYVMISMRARSLPSL